MLTSTLTSTRAPLPELILSSSDSSRRPQVIHSNTSTSFAQQLADALGAYLNQAPTGSSLEINITPHQSQDSGARQFLVTVKDSTAPAATPVATVTATPVTSSPAPTTLLHTDQKEAYWARQPEAVKVLREMKDINERWQKGWQLANQGYSVDTDIMIYHSDPWKTMANRTSAGYKWIPALGQAPVLQPGIVFPGMKTYEPNNPPQGAIEVDMSLFRGLEHTSIWWTEDDVLPS